MANYSLTGGQKKNGSKNADKVTVKGDDNYFEGLAGADTITITSGNSNGVYGNAGNDKIYIKAGWRNYAEGGAGTDTMNISGGTYNTARGGDEKDILSITGKGEGNTVRGNKGNDVITINSTGKYHYVYGDDGNDNITVKKAGANLEIQGGTGQDTITVRKCNSWKIYGDNSLQTDKLSDKKDIITVYSGTGDIDSGYGNDKITINKGVKNKIEISGREGKDTITINAGNKHQVRGGAGQDTIIINKGTGHVIDSDFDDKITLKKGARGTINLNDGDGLKTGFVKLASGSSAKIVFGESLGTKHFEIDAVKGTVVNNKLIVNADFKGYWGDESYEFKQSGADLVMNDKVYIKNFDNGAFAAGIKFEDQSLTVAQIKEKAGWK